MSFRWIFPVIIAVLLLSSLSFAATNDEKAQAVLTKAADILSWPDTPATNYTASQGTGRSYTITETGEKGADMSATIAVFSTEQEPQFWMSFLDQEVDVVHSSYQGRDAEIGTFGENCHPKPLVKFFNDMFSGFFSSIFGDNETNNGCVNDTGSITWTCGDYMFTADDGSTDPSKAGEESNIAAALYGAAQGAGLCEYGDTLVIMVDTPDRHGGTELSTIEERTQEVNKYYGINAMGQLSPFKFSFLTPNGSIQDPWFTLDPKMSDFAYMANRIYGTDAITKAFVGADVPDDLYFERIVVVYPGQGHQMDTTAKLANADSYYEDSHYVEVNAAQGVRKIYYKNLILLSESREVGGWVHEFGHSLTSRYTDQGFNRITDRYNYDATEYPDRQYGFSSKWDLMSDGSYWGGDIGTRPTQMASFTKYAAGWLTYRDATLNTSYTLTALENMKAGDAVLRLDDPTSTDPEDYMIIEARDSTAPYGAPASGVELYQVQWDPNYKHHVINAMGAQEGPKLITSSDGRYKTPTMYSAAPSPGSTRVSPLWQLKYTITSITRQPFTATIIIQNYTPTNLVGAVLKPGPVPVKGAADATTTENAIDNDTMPGMDLHAYDAQGNHVGMNYQTGEYEDNIPGAISSGDLVGAEEWIFVPAGTQVRYEVSTYPTQEFLTNHPELAANATPQTYSATAVKFDAQGNRFEADLGNGSADAGANVTLTNPEDPSVKYQPKTIPGVGNNSNQVCPFLPAFLVLLLLGFMAKKK